MPQIREGTELAHDIFGTTVPVTQHIIGPRDIVKTMHICSN